MKRIVSLLIAVIMVVSMIPPLGVYAADPVTVYMDPANGSNANSGTETAPVKDFAGAYALLQQGGGKIVLLSDATYSSVLTLPACDYPVTITSKTGAEGIRSTAGIVLSGDTTFEDMTLTHLKASSTTTIRGGGHKLTMGEGLTCVPYMDGSTAYYFCLEGGFYSGNDVESTELTIKSGQYRYIYVGSYGTNVTGNAKLTMTGGTATYLAACRTGTIEGNVEMSFSGSAKVDSVVYAGAATSGNVEGNSIVTVGQGVTIKNLYMGSNGAGNIDGTATVIYDGYDGTFTTLKGAGGASCTGTTGTSCLVLKSGTLNKVPTAFDSVDIDIPQGKTLTLACNLSADTLKSSGTLKFSGPVSLTAAAVTGNVACDVEGEALKNQTYVTAPAGAAITFPANTGITEHSGKWLNQDLINFAGLVLQTDSKNTVTLYTGLWRSGDDTEQVAVTPYITETVDGITYRYYSNLEGNYHVLGKRSGYITQYKNIYMSPEEAATRTVETVTLDKRGEGNYLPPYVYVNNDEVMSNPEAWKSDASMYPKYEKYLQNPVFQEGRDPHRMTTGDELAEELIALRDSWEEMYLYSLGESAHYKLDIPLVILTQSDLSAATTLEQAAEALKNDSDKLTVYYRAQMHGNEPAGGEGALAMLYYLADGYGEDILDKINLIIVPRVNPDGSYLYQRRLYSDLDPNRDQLRLESEEMQAVQESYLLFDPEVMIDGHERMWNNQLGDLQVKTDFSVMNSDAYKQTAIALDNAAFAELEANGLNGYYYAGDVNGNDANLGSSYYTMIGSLCVLLESRGIHESDEAMERRVVSQMAAATGVLNYLHENAADVKAIISAERTAVKNNGATYDEDEQFVLKTGSRKATEADREEWGYLNNIGQNINWATGEVAYPVRYPTVYDVVSRSRTAPTAYVIPANLANIDSILALMTMHGISYSYLPEGATLPLQRYSGDTTTATLGTEEDVRFAQGCYVFTMNNEKGLLLATLMEPDNTNVSEYSGTLAQSGKLSVSDTYRYIRNLNAQGTVDYTITDAESVNITVWLDGTNGADTNNGLTETNAVKTLQKAYAILTAAMESAGANSKANLKIVGLYELGAARVGLPAANFHVTISGKTTADGFSFIGGGTSDTSVIDINGPTTFQNMRLHMNHAKNTYNFIGCNGHKVVFGEGMNCTVTKTNCYFALIGGAYNNTAVASTDLTVRSGNWRTIYAGGYTAKVTGQAKADISGCWVYHNIATTYGGTTGSVDIKVENTTVSNYSTSAIYAGATKKNSITGDVTITLGENVVAPAVYASSRDAGNINGTVTIIADGIDLSQVPVYAKYSATTGTTAMAVLQVNEGSITQAMETFATGSNAYIRLGGDSSENITLEKDTYFDLNGKNLTGSVTGEGKLLIFDSANDTYDEAKCGTVAVGTDVQTVVDAPNGNRYIAVTEDNGISFHRLDMKITAVSLRTATGGLYYWADWDCDSTLAGNIENYGIACKLGSAPDAAALRNEIAGATNGAVLYSWMENSSQGDAIFADADADDEITGAIMDGIISDEEIEGYTNAQRGQMPIYAEPYVILRSGEVVAAAGGVNHSLYTVCQAIDEMITGLEASQLKSDYIAYMESLFADVWNKYGLGWNFKNFSKAA